LKILQNKETLEQELLSHSYDNAMLLLMTSGTFGGMDVKSLTDKVLG
jgi:hypothetical protein